MNFSENVIFLGAAFLFKILLIYPTFVFLPGTAASSEDDELGRLYGFRLESSDVARFGEEEEIHDFRAQVYPDTVTNIRLFGSGLKPASWISFTSIPAGRDSDCNDIRSTGIFQIHLTNDSNAVATVKISLPHIPSNFESETFYFCLREETTNYTHSKDSFAIFRHQGIDRWMQIVSIARPVRSHMLPTWLQITMVTFLLIFSGLFSGLNLGLMSLDVTELNIMINSGTKSEKRYAKTILPLRKKGNFLLCTILLGNVLVNNTLAILLDDLTGSGLLAILGATVAIVVFGEIIPQAICSRYGLMVGARTVLFTKFFMVITFPLSYPISLILDCILGKEIGYVFNRDRLRELIRITEDKIDLERDELKIISGALELSKKSIGDVMTKIEDVFMIEIGSNLNFEMMNSIVKTGYTRIPVYEGNRCNIVALLNVKDLAFVDPDDSTPLKTITAFYKHPLHFFHAETRLDIILQEFKKGSSHMAFVQRMDVGGKKETIGIVTLEDVIEEILQSEIVDETDTITDNRAKSPLKNAFMVRDFSYFNQKYDQKQTSISPQMALATFRFLSTSVSAFNSELISEHVLQRLLRENVIRNLNLRSSTTPYLYEVGKVSDHFCMVLDGRVEVEFGKDKVTFEGGPFVYFGVQALIGPPCYQCTNYPNVACILEHIGSGKPHEPYVADYTVKAVTNLQFLCIKRAHYIVAVKATIKEKRKKSNHPSANNNNNNNKNNNNNNNNNKNNFNHTLNSNLMIEELSADSDGNSFQGVSLPGPAKDFDTPGDSKSERQGCKIPCNHQGVGSLNSLPGYSSEKRDSFNGILTPLQHVSYDTCHLAKKRNSLHSLKGAAFVNFNFRDKKLNSGSKGHLQRH